MIYDRLSPRPAACIRLLGNILIAVTFASLVIASYKYAIMMNFQKSPVFRIPNSIIYFPFVYFLLSIIGYTLTEILEDVSVIRGSIPDSRDHNPGEAVK
jgi:TRAP-type C4-dicarboxylate transport system permease small subunit